jgi:hypothetical protein
MTQKRRKNRNKNKKKRRSQHARDNCQELNDATTRGGGPPKAMAMAQARAQSEEGDDESTTSAVTKV